MMTMDAVKTIERDGAVARIFHDDDPANDPREFDNIGVMFCHHPRHSLGDEELSPGDHESFEGVVRFLKHERDAVLVLPLFLLDHSGLSMSAGNPIDPELGPGHVVQEARTTDRFVGDGQGWDTSLVGFIYTTAERVRELCNEYPFKPRDYAGTHDEWLEEALRAEVSEYDDFLQGQVYCYEVESVDDGRTLESCGGHIGYEHAVACTEQALDDAIAAVRRERDEVADWAARDVRTTDGEA